VLKGRVADPGVREAFMSNVQPILVVYGAVWCPDARRIKRYLDENHVHYEWHDINEEPEAKEFVKKVNHGQVVLPTIVFPDGSILAEPSRHALAEKLSSQSQ
jgi:glutaredoxin-like protein